MIIYELEYLNLLCKVEGFTWFSALELTLIIPIYRCEAHSKRDEHPFTQHDLTRMCEMGQSLSWQSGTPCWELERLLQLPETD